MKKNAEPYFEVNFDGIVGPTHNYAGLSFGNRASIENKQDVSFPKKAALQGLLKMKSLSDLGYPQAVLPPHPRPYEPLFRRLGFSKSEVTNEMSKIAQSENFLFVSGMSASAMWTANACTTAASCDSTNSRLNFCSANLTSKLHRSIEAEFTSKILSRIFEDSELFYHSNPVPGVSALGDEGAANHTRFSDSEFKNSIHLFVYGTSADSKEVPLRFPARQTAEASRSVARLLKLDFKDCLFIQQSPLAIDAGVFHNDVIAVGHQNFLFAYQDAFLNQEEVIQQIRMEFERRNLEFLYLEVLREELSIEDCVSSYLFNSQLLKRERGGFLILTPSECQENPRVKSYLDGLLQKSDSPIREWMSFDLRESMKNGGGPACLRNRIVLNEREKAAVRARVFLDQQLYENLGNWIEDFYVDELDFNKLQSKEFIEQSKKALLTLEGILRLPDLYKI